MPDPNYTGSNADTGSASQSCHSGYEQLQDEPDDSSDDDDKKVHKKFRISVFFDGTFNNMANANQAPDSDGSYANDISNVVLLFQKALTDTASSPDYDSHSPIYVEGIGTTDGTADSNYGAATGAGDTGIVAKVTKGIEKTIKSITDIIEASVDDKDKTVIDKIHIDAFGFSRGAAAARSFVYRVLTDPKDNLKKQLAGYSVSEVKVLFVGVFDTVAAYKGTDNLHLDSLSSGDVVNVIQLAAADEHRKNFPITNIKSAGGKGLEIFLPGVHSDIGGGYPDGNIEDLKLVSGNAVYLTDATITDITQLINSGWVDKTDIKNQSKDGHSVYLIRDQNIKDGFDKYNSLYVIRNGKGHGLTNQYRRIPLRVMGNKATTLATLKFSPQMNTDDDTSVLEGVVLPEIIEINNMIVAYVAKGSSAATDWQANTPLLKLIRHDHLHFSSYYTALGINDPRFADGKRTREIING